MQSLARAPQIGIKDSVFDPDSTDREIQYYKIDSKRYAYRVFVYLTGQRLVFVDKVQYTLHPSFENPIHIVSRTPINPSCKLLLWAWGAFTVRARVFDKESDVYNLVHYLTFPSQIEKAANQEGVRFTEVTSSQVYESEE
jgi:transcription initiation factor IIF auxiliary subunit